jgi:hypothetical protein
MDNAIFLTSVCISIVYLLFKFIEMRFVLKENKPMKLLFRDTIIVYFSVVIGYLVYNQFNEQTIEKATEVFTNAPGF